MPCNRVCSVVLELDNPRVTEAPQRTKFPLVCHAEDFILQFSASEHLNGDAIPVVGEIKRGEYLRHSSRSRICTESVSIIEQFQGCNTSVRISR